MPIDYYVNAATGNDANNGNARRPVRSIHRAAEIAAINIGMPDRDTGRILVSAGTYAPPDENFPIFIPPGFDLVGAGSGLTVIEFTGEVRTSPADPTITYWGGTAIMAGRRVQGLTLVANPRPPGYDCSAMIGIDCIDHDTVVEDVHVFLPEPFDRTDGFSQSIRMRGIGGSVLSTRIERNPNWSGLALLDTTVTVDGLEIRDAYCQARDQRGSRISGSMFEQGSYASLSGDVRFDQNTFRGNWIYAWGTPGATGPGIGPRNDIVCIGVSVGGSVVVEDNQILSNYETLSCGGQGTPIIRGNTIGFSGNGRALLNVYFPSTPRIENNYFSTYTPTGRRGIYALTLPMLKIGSEADFGGGTQGSAGGNHFKCVYAGSNRNETDVPGGGTVFMSDNFWHDIDIGRLESWMGTTPGTTVVIENPQRDPELCARPELPERFREQRHQAGEWTPQGPIDLNEDKP